MNAVSLFRLGTLPYEEACRLQDNLGAARAREETGDALLLLQHPPVITIGRGGGKEDILACDSLLSQAGIRVLPTDRGGRATYHGPGQLVAYPILQLPNSDLHDYVSRLEEVIIRVLGTYGLAAHRKAAHPGVWLSANKIAAVGVAVRKGVTRHGIALNVAPEMAHFDLLIPCGITEGGVTSMARELEEAPGLGEVTGRFVQAFDEVFECQIVDRKPDILERFSAVPHEQPSWLWQRISSEAEAAVDRVEHWLDELGLHTVCQEAHCPNIAECFGENTATFMILGNVCTRGCRFCAVKEGRPSTLDPGEPERVAEGAARLGLRHVVITSVTRDDLPDGGASQFAATVRAIHRRLPEAKVEVLIPDFSGSRTALETVLGARPDVLNHNIETVPRLYPRVRPRADYRRSLGVLAWAKTLMPQMMTKSGLMLGLGERTPEAVQVLYDLRQARCDLLTLGQYLQPTDRQVPIDRYVPPDEFAWYEIRAKALGFLGTAAGPLVRSSHRAEALWKSSSVGHSNPYLRICKADRG